MGIKITIYQIDDIETGPKTIEIGGSSLRAIYSTRSRLNDLLKRNEYKNPGVYILKSYPYSQDYSERVYIGEADPLVTRLNQHIKDVSKDFSECVAIYSSNKGELTKAHIKYIESKLYKLANECKTSEIDNSNRPTKSTLSEADESMVDKFIQQIKVIMPLLGFQFLVPSIAKTDQMISEGVPIFKLVNKGQDSSLIITEQGYIVLKNSTACKESLPSMGSYRKLKDRLVASGILFEEDDKYVFVQDTIFPSASAASSIILGTNSSGPALWKTSEGKSINDLKTP